MAYSRGLITQSHPSDRGTMITMSGSLDAANSANAAWYIDAQLASSRGDVVFDLSSLEVVAPTGVELFVQARRHLAVQGRRVYFEGPVSCVDTLACI